MARMLADRGAYVVNADEVAREVVAPGSTGLSRLVAEFGSAILHPDGTLDRQRLAAVAFADQSKRAKLDAITHPLIRERTAQRFAAGPSAPGAIQVHDIPLLAELGLASEYDVVIVVDCPDEIRLARLRERGLTEPDAQARMAAQATREQRLAVSDLVIDNSGDDEALRREVDKVWQRLKYLAH